MSKNEIKTTVVIVPRESFNMFIEVIEQVYKITAPIFKMIVMEGHAPEPVRKKLREFEKTKPNFRVVWSERWILSSEAVNLSMPLIDTEYVCYVDNDVEVMEGWLENLVKCAEEEKAGCVHPIYLTTKLNDPYPKIHVAEGKLIRKPLNGKMYVDSVMTYSGKKLDEYPDQKRKESDFFEWHCVLFRKSLLDKVGPQDDINIAEHIDYSLRIQKAGEKILLEPKSVVAYEYERIWRLRGQDREYMLFRWNVDKANRSLLHLAKKWDWAPESILRRQYWVKEHTGRVRSTYPLPKVINKLRRMVGMENMAFTKEERPVLPAGLYES